MAVSIGKTIVSLEIEFKNWNSQVELQEFDQDQGKIVFFTVRFLNIVVIFGRNLPVGRYRK